MKYLIIKCEEIFNPNECECDVKRTPICVTDNCLQYNCYGYEIYKICPDGSLKLIKDYTFWVSA